MIFNGHEQKFYITDILMFWHHRPKQFALNDRLILCYSYFPVLVAFDSDSLFVTLLALNNVGMNLC